MANINRGEVPVTINGQTFTLKFDGNALAELEMKLDIQIGGEPEKNDPFGKGLFSGTRALLWSALLHDHPALTIHEVGAMLTSLAKQPEEFRELRRALIRAYAAAWPDPPAEEKESDPSKNAQAASPGVGNDLLSSPAVSD